MFKRFMNDESGATAIEYGLLAACIALVILPMVSILGTLLKAEFLSVAGAV